MPEKKKKKSGRPGKYEEWLKPENLILVQGWKMDGLTDEQVAHNIGINPVTLIEWKKRFPEFAKAIKMSAEVADRIIENALFKKAKDGNIAAIIFYLKNRKPDVWREEKATKEEKELQELQARKLKEEIKKMELDNGTGEVDDGVTIIDDLPGIEEAENEECEINGNDNPEIL